jgi:hypothetical protein
MRAAKFACGLACVLSLWHFFAIIHGIRTPRTDALFNGHSILAAIGPLAIPLMCGVEYFGIHRRALFAWKLGWGLLAAMFLQFLVDGGFSALQQPEADYPWVAFAALVLGGSVVVAYWGFWWKRQKNYFTTQSPATQKTRTKRLAVVLCIVALVFAGIAWISGSVAKYHELSHQAVQQFHEQLASGQYAEIYEAADETLRDTTSKSDFVNLLQAVHERLGDVESLNPGWQGIAFHGGQRMTISEYFDTKFAHGRGTEWFVWQAHDNHLTLGHYQIKSSVLTSR